MAKHEQTSEPIKAPPGTPEYDRQFKYQGLTAAAAALRLWVVRIPCGILGISSVVSVFSSFDWSLSKILVAFWVGLIAVELFTVCFSGRSWYLRFALARIQKNSVPNDEQRNVD